MKEAKPRKTSNQEENFIVKVWPAVTQVPVRITALQWLL